MVFVIGSIAFFILKILLRFKANAYLEKNIFESNKIEDIAYTCISIFFVLDLIAIIIFSISTTTGYFTSYINKFNVILMCVSLICENVFLFIFDQTRAINNTTAKENVGLFGTWISIVVFLISFFFFIMHPTTYIDKKEGIVVSRFNYDIIVIDSKKELKENDIDKYYLSAKSKYDESKEKYAFSYDFDINKDKKVNEINSIEYQELPILKFTYNGTSRYIQRIEHTKKIINCLGIERKEPRYTYIINSPTEYEKQLINYYILDKK